MCFSNFKKRSFSCIHKIITAATMNMYINKTRRYIFSICINFNRIINFNIFFTYFCYCIISNKHTTTFNKF